MSESVILLTSRVNDDLVEYVFLQVIEITPLSLSNDYRREALGQLDSDSFVGHRSLWPVWSLIEFSRDSKKVYQDVCAHVGWISFAWRVNMLFQSAASSFQLRKGLSSSSPSSSSYFCSVLFSPWKIPCVDILSVLVLFSRSQMFVFSLASNSGKVFQVYLSFFTFIYLFIYFSVWFLPLTAFSEIFFCQL